MTGYLIKATDTENGSILYLSGWVDENDTTSVDLTYNINEATFLTTSIDNVNNYFINLIKAVKGDKYKCEVVKVQRTTVIVESNMNLA